jgi:hypothetical protein
MNTYTTISVKCKLTTQKTLQAAFGCGSKGKSTITKLLREMWVEIAFRTLNTIKKHS